MYLSSDSANVMQTVEEDKVYIIGGLVDHNKHKVITANIQKYTVMFLLEACRYFILYFEPH